VTFTNRLLELGHALEPAELRTTEFAPALRSPVERAASPLGYASPEVALPWKGGRFSGSDFVLQPDGTLRCPADQALVRHEQRPEADGSLRLVYAASIRSCRPCPLREQCQWNGRATAKPRQVSVLLHPLAVGSAPLLWHDWSRRQHRRACTQLLSHQRVEIQGDQRPPSAPEKKSVLLSRAQRAHSRLTFQERLTRNARVPGAAHVRMKLFGVPNAFATALGLMTT
jgi:hypothetical protein